MKIPILTGVLLNVLLSNIVASHEIEATVFIGDDPVELLTVHADVNTIQHREAASTVWVEKKWEEKQERISRDGEIELKFNRTRSRYAFACNESLKIETDIWYYLNSEQIDKQTRLKDLRDTRKMYRMDDASDSERTLMLLVCDGVFEPVKPSPRLSEVSRKIQKLERHIEQRHRYSSFLYDQMSHANSTAKNDEDKQKANEWMQKWIAVEKEIEDATNEIVTLRQTK